MPLPVSQTNRTHNLDNLNSREFVTIILYRLCQFNKISFKNSLFTKMFYKNIYFFIKI